MTNDQVLTGIGATSVGVARARAAESRRADRLFDDPYARDFVGAAARETAMMYEDAAALFWAELGDQVALRTRFLDDCLTDANAAGIRQIVILGAGLDTRAYRLAWRPGTRVVEVDLPDVHAFKDAVLTRRRATPAATRTTVSADLAGDWATALRKAGYDPGEPTFWLLEGLLYSQGPVGCDRLLGQVTELSAAGSELAFDHMAHSPRVDEALRAIDPALVDLWKGGPDDEPGTWLAEYGWAPSVREIADLAAEHGRPAPPAFDPSRPGAVAGQLVHARRP